MIEYDKTVSPDDNMDTASLDAYFNTTEKAIECILQGLQHANRSAESIRTVLDFGCGYGRVYRALPFTFPNASLTACDLIEAGARFCAETFGGNWVKSHEEVANISFPGKFDLVWLGSVFTHLPEPRWHKMLDFLASITERDGLVVFTVHGECAIKFIENVILKRNPYIIPAEKYQEMKHRLPSAGIYFLPQAPGNYKYSVEHGMDISVGEYGCSFTTESWVTSFVKDKPEWRLVNYAAPGWGRNHDAVTLMRV